MQLLTFKDSESHITIPLATVNYTLNPTNWIPISSKTKNQLVYTS